MAQVVFRGYDREALDPKYNNRAKVIVAELEESSSALSRLLARQMVLA